LFLYQTEGQAKKEAGRGGKKKRGKCPKSSIFWSIPNQEKAEKRSLLTLVAAVCGDALRK